MIPFSFIKNVVPVLYSSASSVDGVFIITADFGNSVYGISKRSFTVTNGICEYVTTINNSTWYAFITPNGAGSVQVSFGASNTVTTTINAAWQFLTQAATSNMYYDFRELVGRDGNAIKTYDPAIQDFSGNNRALALIGTPLLNVLTPGLPAFRDLTANCFSTGETGSTYLNTNFSVNFKWKPTDGQSSTVQHICGNKDATNTGLVISIQTNGKLRINYQGFIWDSTNVVFANGVNAYSYFDIHFDFTTDVLTVRQDGSTVAGSFTTSNISAVNPASYGCTVNFYIGSFNNNGSAFSNSDSASLDYFTLTSLQVSPFTAVASYLNAKSPMIEYLGSLTDVTYLKNPHDVNVSTDMTKAFVSGKGDTNLTTVDGSFGIIDLTTPGTPTVLGGYAGVGNQKDGETIQIISATRVVHFVDKAALLFNVSNPASPSLVKSVATSVGVVNGSIYKNGYVIGANKSGYIDVFDFTDIDNFTLVGSKDFTATMIGPHDIDIDSTGQYVIISAKTTGAEFGIVQVFNGTTLIALASWTFASTVTSSASPNLIGANRIRKVVNNGVDYAVLFQLQGGGGGDNVVTYDISNLASPVYKADFSLAQTSQRGATGACVYRNKYVFVGNDQGVRLLDVTSSASAITQIAGYFNGTAFSLGANNNIHDIDWWFSGQNRYIIITAQNEGIAIFKINRV